MLIIINIDNQFIIKNYNYFLNTGIFAKFNYKITYIFMQNV